MLPCAPIHTDYVPTASALNPLPGLPSTTSEPTTPPPGPGITPSAADLDVQASPQPISLSTSEKKLFWWMRGLGLFSWWRLGWPHWMAQFGSRCRSVQSWPWCGQLLAELQQFCPITLKVKLHRWWPLSNTTGRMSAYQHLPFVANFVTSRDLPIWNPRSNIARTRLNISSTTSTSFVNIQLNPISLQNSFRTMFLTLFYSTVSISRHIWIQLNTWITSSALQQPLSFVLSMTSRKGVFTLKTSVESFGWSTMGRSRCWWRGCVMTSIWMPGLQRYS